MHFGERQSKLKFKQLNPFELKSEISQLLEKINSVADVQNCLDNIDLLDAQEDNTLIRKLLFKELINSDAKKIPIICFLLEHFIEKSDLIKGYWEILQNKALSGEIRITVLNILRELDSDWSFEDYNFDDDDEILDENTKQMLNSAIINPEVQIDFMDFMQSIKVEDRITLINSLSDDFSEDVLANILIPVFESDPNSVIGQEALKLLAQTKSQLALRVLSKMIDRTKGELNQTVRKSLAELKMSGMRTDNTKEFYSKILANTKPDKFYTTYPDGHGDMALIFTRVTNEGRVRFVSIVINIDTGIKDCFGFFDISQFECDKILERFLRDEKVASLSPSDFVSILYNAENTTIANNSDWNLPYEYVCWRNLLLDIDYQEEDIEHILKEQVVPASVDNSIFDKLSGMKVSARWFLDGNYSDEFEELIKKLKNTDDLNNLIEKCKDFVFYDEEKISWCKKLKMCAFIKYAIGKDDESSMLYGLACNENIFDEFLTEILKRSIYEYLITIKYNKDLNTEGFTDEDISAKINYIESKWVKSNV